MEITESKYLVASKFHGCVTILVDGKISRDAAFGASEKLQRSGVGKFSCDMTR